MPNWLPRKRVGRRLGVTREAATAPHRSRTPPPHLTVSHPTGEAGEQKIKHQPSPASLLAVAAAAFRISEERFAVRRLSHRSASLLKQQRGGGNLFTFSFTYST